MGEPHKPVWHALREHATHWMIGGVLLAATGFAPEEWLARAMHSLQVPENALHLWNAGIDLRTVPIVLGVALIVGDMLWRKHAAHAATEPSPVPDRPEALPLPDRPSIAVLPFANLSGDSEQEYFSDGVADDIITELSRDRALFVIARNSSFTYRGRSIDIKQVGRELGVHYVVEGSVRRETGRVRVTAQLIDATTGNHVWAERYDRALEHVFDVQDEVAQSVANAIRPAVGSAEQRRVVRKTPGSLSACEAYQRGLWHLSTHTTNETGEARRWFGQAANDDPGFASAFIGLAVTHALDAAYGTRQFAEVGPLALAEARKAVAIDPSDSEAQAALALAFAFIGDLDAALECTDRGLAFNRNSAAAHECKGGTLIHLGRYEEGRSEALIALRLNPRDPNSSMAASVITQSYYFKGDNAGAVAAARRYLPNYSVHPAIRRTLLAALGQLGFLAEAQTVLREWQASTPDQFRIMAAKRPRPPFMLPAYYEHLNEGLRKAGLDV